MLRCAGIEALRAILALPGHQELAKRLGTFRVAVVVWKDSSFGMARMTEVYAEPAPATVRAFRDAKEAEAWLQEEPS